MGREKANYRDMLYFLNTNCNMPPLVSRKDAAKILGISHQKLSEYIADGDIKIKNNKISIGAIARLLCD